MYTHCTPIAARKCRVCRECKQNRPTNSNVSAQPSLRAIAAGSSQWPSQTNSRQVPTWLLLHCFVFSWHRPLSRRRYSNSRRQVLISDARQTTLPLNGTTNFNGRLQLAKCQPARNSRKIWTVCGPVCRKVFTFSRVDRPSCHPSFRNDVFACRWLYISRCSCVTWLLGRLSSCFR